MTDSSARNGVTGHPLAWFDRAAGVAEQVIAGIGPDRLDGATPCPAWSVRELINHVVSGNLAFAARVAGGPPPDRSLDHLGDDPLGAFRASARDLRAALSAEGALARTYTTPLGDGPGTMLATLRAMEMTVHAWDLAKATGQSTDLDPELAEYALAGLRRGLPAQRAGGPFGPEQPVPEGATAADRVAAFAGRAVT